MGVTRGVLVQPKGQIVGVDIPMSNPLDRAIEVSPAGLAASPTGPDRVISTLALALAGLRPSC